MSIENDHLCDGLLSPEDMSPLSDIDLDYDSPSIVFSENSLQLDMEYSLQGGSPVPTRTPAPSRALSPEDGMTFTPSPSADHPKDEPSDDSMRLDTPALQDLEIQDLQIGDRYPEYPLDNSNESFKYEDLRLPAPHFTWEGPWPNAASRGSSQVPDAQLLPRHMSPVSLGSACKESPSPKTDVSTPPRATRHSMAEPVLTEDGRIRRSNSIPYAQYIWLALRSSETHSLSLPEIYQWFRDNTNKTSEVNKGWQNSIRHNLSMNGAFSKEDTIDSKKSSMWVLEDWALEGVFSTTRYRGKGGPSKDKKSPKRLGANSSAPKNAAHDRSMSAPTPGRPALAAGLQFGHGPGPGRLLAPSPSVFGHPLTAASSPRVPQRRYPHPRPDFATYLQSISPNTHAQLFTQPRPSVAPMAPMPMMMQHTAPVHNPFIAPPHQQLPIVPTLLGHRDPMPQPPPQIFVRDMQRSRGQRPLSTLAPEEQQVDSLFTDPFEAASYLPNNYTWDPAPDGNSFTYPGNSGFNGM